MITWKDKQGFNYVMSDETARSVLKSYYDAWPDGLSEIESALDSHKALILWLIEKYVPEKDLDRTPLNWAVTLSELKEAYAGSA